jgi:pimeloyl-ACP methyl ester carboxylesterase
MAGHSMGGYVALAFFRMYAERVAGLSLVASQVAADTPARAIERDAQAQAVLARGMAALSDAVVAGVLAPAFGAAHPETVERLRAIVATQDSAGAAAQIIGMKERVDSADLLEDIAVPALVIAGLADPILGFPALERIAGAIADCEFVGLPGVGHLPMIEAPAATTAALERLVERCAVNRPRDPNSARATHA